MKWCAVSFAVSEVMYSDVKRCVVVWRVVICHVANVCTCHVVMWQCFVTPFFMIFLSV